VSENHKQATAHSANDQFESNRALSRSPRELDRSQMRGQRIEAVKAEVADAAALRSKMIEAMRRKLESEARHQAEGGSHAPGELQGEQIAAQATNKASEGRWQTSPPATPPTQQLARTTKPIPAIYAVKRPPSRSPEASDGNEADSIFAPETGINAPGDEPRPPQPRPLNSSDPEIWDEAFQSAQRVEKALARLTQALAQDEGFARKEAKPSKAKTARGRSPRPLRVVALFAASFMIGISAIILAYDWYAGASVEKRLVQFLDQLLPGKPEALASNSAPLAAQPAEKPLAARATVTSQKTLATVKLEAFDAQGKADANIPLSIHAIGTTPEQAVDIRLAGLPGDAELSAGQRQADGSWLLKPGEQSGLTIQVPSEASGNLLVAVEALEQKTGELAAPPQEIRIKIAPAKIVVEPAGSAITPVMNLRESPAPLPPAEKKIATELPPAELQIAAIEETAEVPAMAIGIDDPARPLMARGDALLDLGDVVSARSFYDRAFELGNVRAARSIARTYDPMVLASMKVQGLRADPAKALEWYRKAEKAGESDAAQAIAALETFLQQ
jgi:tetratricopeptide (TPR) repeat protein